MKLFIGIWLGVILGLCIERTMQHIKKEKEQVMVIFSQDSVILTSKDSLLIDEDETFYPVYISSKGVK